MMGEDVHKIRVKIIRAKGLKSADLNGTSDPYCVVKWNKTKLRTGVVWRNLNPVWGDEKVIKVVTGKNAGNLHHDVAAVVEDLEAEEIVRENLENEDRNGTNQNPKKEKKKKSSSSKSFKLRPVAVKKKNKTSKSDSSNRVLTVECWDKDRLKFNDPLGKVDFNVDEILDNPAHFNQSIWYELSPFPKHKSFKHGRSFRRKKNPSVSDQVQQKPSQVSFNEEDANNLDEMPEYGLIQLRFIVEKEDESTNTTNSLSSEEKTENLLHDDEMKTSTALSELTKDDLKGPESPGSSKFDDDDDDDCDDEEDENTFSSSTLMQLTSSSFELETSTHVTIPEENDDDLKEEQEEEEELVNGDEEKSFCNTIHGDEEDDEDDDATICSSMYGSMNSSMHRTGLDLATHVFRKYDLDGNGIVDQLEFHQMCCSLGYYFDDQELKDAFRILDQDGSGVIELVEFVKFWQRDDRFKYLQLNQRQRDKVEQIAQYFSYFDKEAAGKLSRSQFRAMYDNMLSAGYTLRHFDAFWDELDINKDHFVHFNELLAFFISRGLLDEESNKSAAAF